MDSIRAAMNRNSTELSFAFDRIMREKLNGRDTINLAGMLAFCWTKSRQATKEAALKAASSSLATSARGCFPALGALCIFSSPNRHPFV
jgi:hypothetical protein